MGIVLAGDKEYLTYLDNGVEFSRDLISTNLNTDLRSKPRRAWWGSPVDASYSWKDWCESEGFGNYNFDNPVKWKLKPDSKILQIGWDEVSNIDTDNIILKYCSVRDFKRSYTEIFEETMENKVDILTSGKWGPQLILNFESMIGDDITAVELMDACIGHRFSNGLEDMFNCWDCESIAVLQPDNILFEV